MYNMNNIKFNSYQDADDIAPYIKDYYFSDTLIGIKLELTESEILDYLYELGYKGDDRGKFLDMVISSLVNIGVTIKQDDENYNEDNDMPFLKASMGIILPDDGFKVTFTNPLNNKTFMGSNSMEEWQDYLRNMSEYERRDAIVTSIKYGHEIKGRGELPEDYFYNNGGEIQITKDDFLNNREISVGMGVKVVLKKTETHLYVAEDYMLNESGVWERYGLIGSKNYQDVVNELNNIIKNKGYDQQFENGGELSKKQRKLNIGIFIGELGKKITSNYVIANYELECIYDDNYELIRKEFNTINKKKLDTKEFIKIYDERINYLMTSIMSKEPHIKREPNKKYYVYGVYEYNVESQDEIDYQGGYIYYSIDDALTEIKNRRFNLGEEVDFYLVKKELKEDGSRVDIEKELVDKLFKEGGILTIDDYINKRYRRNDTYDDLSFVSKNFYRTTESMIREHLQNGEICICKLKKILGKTPDYPSQVVGSLKLTKCFLRPYYKI